MADTAAERAALKAASDEVLLAATLAARKVMTERGLDPNTPVALAVRMDAFQRLTLAFAQACGFDLEETAKQLRQCLKAGIEVTEYDDDRVRRAANAVSELNESGYQPGATLH